MHKLYQNNIKNNIRHSHSQLDLPIASAQLAPWWLHVAQVLLQNSQVQETTQDSDRDRLG